MLKTTTAMFALLVGLAPASAQLAISANDGKAILVNGVAQVPANPPPDSVTVINLDAFPPKVVGTVQAPASIIGPPQSAAISPDKHFALVTGATKVDPADPSKTAPDDVLSVIDLESGMPKVVQTLHTGAGASGVAINKTGTLAVVANRAEGTLSVFTIAGKNLTPVDKLTLGDAKSGPSGAVFTPDGKTVLVTRDGDNRISVIGVEGTKLTYAGHDVFAGLRPYGIMMGQKGDIAVVANIGMGSGDEDSVSIIDLKSGPPRVVATQSVGPTPEGIALSADEKFLAVAAMNGSNRVPGTPLFHDFGLLRIFRLNGTALVPVASAHIGHWCQGMAWNRTASVLLVECAAEKKIQVFRFDGHKLVQAAPIVVEGGPSGIAVSE
jgi:DNA-binding beta-propeller fold protein YncE